MRWALAVRDPDDWLALDDPELITRNDGMFKHHLDRYKYADRYGSDPDLHRAAGLAFLKELDARLAGGGHLSGARAGLADAAIFPFVRQFAAVDRLWFAAQPLPRVQAWLAHHLASDLFEAVMQRFSPWRRGDAPVVVQGMS